MDKRISKFTLKPQDGDTYETPTEFIPIDAGFNMPEKSNNNIGRMEFEIKDGDIIIFPKTDEQVSAISRWFQESQNIRVYTDDVVDVPK